MRQLKILRVVLRVVHQDWLRGPLQSYSGPPIHCTTLGGSISLGGMVESRQKISIQKKEQDNVLQK